VDVAAGLAEPDGVGAGLSVTVGVATDLLGSALLALDFSAPAGGGTGGDDGVQPTIRPIATIARTAVTA
jgi:hypothetical protein